MSKVLLIVLDSLNRERFDCWNGFDREDGQPNVYDNLSKEGAYEMDSIASASWTVPAVMTMLSGIPAYKHKILYGPWLKEYKFIWDYLEGYEQLYATTRADGFQHRFNKQIDMANYRSMWNQHLFEDVITTLASTDKAFVFLHIWETHAPYYHERAETYPFMDEVSNYMVPWINHGEIEKLHSKHNKMMANVEAFLKGLIITLKAAGVYDNLNIILTSDHGDEWGEHVKQGSYTPHMLHRPFLYDTILRVPLIIKAPENEPLDFLSKIGVMPQDKIFSLLQELLGVRTAELEDYQGRFEAKEVISWANFVEQDDGIRGERFSMWTPEWKVIRTKAIDDITHPLLARGPLEIYDTYCDPDETTSYTLGMKSQAEAAKKTTDLREPQKLMFKLEKEMSKHEEEPDPEEMKRILNSLGYI